MTHVPVMSRFWTILALVKGTGKNISVIDTGLLVHFMISKIVSFERFYPLGTKYQVGNDIGFSNVIWSGFFSG